MKKQTFVDPFTSEFNPESNADYFSAPLSSFLQLTGKPEQFYNSINKLFRIQQRLKIIENVAKLQEVIDGFNAFKQAIDWLRKGSPITTGQPVATINSYDEINEESSNAFDRYITWFESAYLVSRTPYLHAVFALSAVQVDATDILQNKTTNLQAEITRAGNKKIEEVVKTGTLEKEKLSKFVALDEWAKHYDNLTNNARETLYGNKTNGNRTPNTISPKPLSKRLVYCWFLFAIAIVVALLQDWSTVWDSLETGDVKVIGSEIFSHIWLFIFPSILYSFTVKNYRIAKNQLAQNEQRATNARVLQNMLEAKESISEKSMEQIVAFASDSLFTIKNTGELSKKEIEASGAVGVIKSLIPK